MVQEHRELRVDAANGGVIAGQEWKPVQGEEVERKVLLLHGWQDNSNSFGPLVAQLPESWWMVAMDFPGHGYSTARPPGAPYHVTDWIFDVRQVIEKLGWQKMTIIGHSMGAGVGLVFASLFPERVDAMISLDVVKQISCPGGNVAAVMRRAILALTEHDGEKGGGYVEKPNETFPTLQAARDWWYERNQQFMSRASADLILERGVRHRKDLGDYEILRDIRLTFPPLFRVPLDQHRAILKELVCDLMIVKALGAQDWEPKPVLDEFLDMYKHNCKRFENVPVEGLHHVHLDKPDTVAPLITDFLAAHPQINGTHINGHKQEDN